MICCGGAGLGTRGGIAACAPSREAADAPLAAVCVGRGKCQAKAVVPRRKSAGISARAGDTGAIGALTTGSTIYRAGHREKTDGLAGGECTLCGAAAAGVADFRVAASTGPDVL